MKERRLGLIDAASRSKPPVLQFLPQDGWRLWTTYNQELTKGTYIALHSDGTMQRVSVHNDYTQTIQPL